ncbi:MAG: hydroxymethylglutaryl-CoA reductase, degradative [Gammaproteobacteria bacterium]|nr:hydroxymethylglutaryl-CoA reductase, degradative [Gammaproteobacteria bacterium]
MDSRLPGFYRLSVDERIDRLLSGGFLSEDDAQVLRSGAPLLGAGPADRMIENVIGVFGLPLAVATNFRINGRDHVVPMVVEEPSIVAGVSGAAKLMRNGRGIEARVSEPLLIGQISLVPVAEAAPALDKIEAEKNALVRLANESQPRLVARGGGVRDIETRYHDLGDGTQLPVVHVLVDTRDAMGANVVNSICEFLAPDVEKICGLTASLKILSNLADRSIVEASVVVRTQDLAMAGFSGESVRDRIVGASEFARVDRYRAATHNKGIMNGIDAVAIATGNDWRAIEAAAHAFAARDGQYRSLSAWTIDADSNLAGALRLPVKIGTVGGSLRANPAVALGLQIAGVDSARMLTEVMGATGLAQNFAALRALASSGIQSGHMRLHARSVAASVGTPDSRFDAVVDGLIASGEIKAWKAREILQALDTAPAQDAPATNTVSAAAKIILLGEHAAVYNKHVLALPIPNALTATATKAESGLRLVVDDWRVDVSTGKESPPDDGAVTILNTIAEHLDMAGRGCHVNVTATVPPGVGLGSSASLATVIVRAISACFGLNLDAQAENEIVFRCEQKMHGDPSGVDNLLAVYAEPMLYRKGLPVSECRISLKNLPPLLIAVSSKPGSTREQVSKVRVGYEANPNLYARLFDQIDRLSVAGCEALQNEDYSGLGAMMNVCHGLLNALQVSTPELERMVDIARRNGAVGAKLTGAGGGGAVVALCPGSSQQVSTAWRRAGYDVLDLAHGND